jgi:general secretion pathway protein G
VQIDGIETAAKYYAVDHAGAFPSSIEELFINPGSDTNWKGPYLENATQTPNDPWGMPIQYAYPGQNKQQGADIWSTGPDKQNNTADDINNWTRY